MIGAAPLLVELLTEELPPNALRRLGEAFAEALVADLRADGFAPGDGPSITYASPRRLAVLIQGVTAQAPDQEILVKGPSVKAALSADGTPTPALAGFMKKAGIASLERLTRASDGKQECFYYRELAKGGRLEATLDLKVETALAKLPIPKMMRWGDSDARFVRPVRGLVMLHGSTVVPGRVLGRESGRITWGHRFMGSGTVEIPSADLYEALLEDQGRVIASFARRLAMIRESLAARAGGASIAADDALFEEVAALVEYPVVYEGAFLAAFLEVPQECLMLTMRQNQKYFPLVDGRGKLLNRFLLVSNMETTHPHHIIHGNERVLRARLADAKFFYDQDRRRRLESRVPQLATVVFHNKLGSQLARVERIERLAGDIARRLGANVRRAQRAAQLAKADLLSGMVGEFPELQGVMGEYYARHDGEEEPVARAIEAHYRPRFAGDALPEDAIGDCVALADKLDTLTGIWGIGLAPTGDKDPFALRRAALGCLRILVEHALPLDLCELLDGARANYAGTPLADDTVGPLHAFVLDRMRGYLRERAYAADEIESVLAGRPSRLDRVIPRLDAVQAFRRLPEAATLAAANKRIRNILRKTARIEAEPSAARLRDPAERELFDAVASLAPQAAAHVEAQRYTQALKLLAGARGAVDRFFDEVLVMADDVALRENRLALLARLDRLMNEVADISKLAA